MQKVFTLILIFIVSAANAQIGKSFQPVTRLENVSVNDSTVQKKWSITKYSGLSASFTSFRGGSAMVYAAPMGIQLNRTINKNLYAFAGVEIAPSYINFNQRFVQGNNSKTGFSNSFLGGNNNQFAINPSAFVGMGYTNDERTFQIQARLNVSQGNYYNNPAGFGNFYRQGMQMNPAIFR